MLGKLGAPWSCVVPRGPLLISSIAAPADHSSSPSTPTSPSYRPAVFSSSTQSPTQDHLSHFSTKVNPRQQKTLSWAHAVRWIRSEKCLPSLITKLNCAVNSWRQHQQPSDKAFGRTLVLAERPSIQASYFENSRSRLRSWRLDFHQVIGVGSGW